MKKKERYETLKLLLLIKNIFDKFIAELSRKEIMQKSIENYGYILVADTMEDVIETLLGLEITDEKDTITDMQKYARERWKTRQKKYHLLENFQQTDEEKNSIIS